MSRKCPALQGRPGRSQKGPKSRYSVNLEIAKAVYSNAWCSHSSRFRRTCTVTFLHTFCYIHTYTHTYIHTYIHTLLGLFSHNVN